MCLCWFWYQFQLPWPFRHFAQQHGKQNSVQYCKNIATAGISYNYHGPSIVSHNNTENKTQLDYNMLHQKHHSIMETSPLLVLVSVLTTMALPSFCTTTWKTKLSWTIIICCTSGP